MSNIIKGEWSLVQWNPDIATEEYLNIGVSFKHEDKKYFKMLDSFNRVNCLYDEDTVRHLQDVIELSLRAFEADNFYISDQIRLIDKGLAKGQDEEKILERLYSRVVTLGKTHLSKNKAKNDFRYIKNEPFLKRATTNLRQRINSKDEYKHLLALFPEDSYLRKNNSDLYVPMRSSANYGSFVSVVTNNVDTINTNYLMLATDLLTASQIDKKGANFFVLRPSADELKKLDEVKVDEIDETLDKLDFKFKGYDFKIESADSEGELNDKMLFWLGKEAA
ncbi:hypothetical protein D3C72_279090 [compost metagenome]